MKSLASTIAAQVGAEMRTRLRSTGTLVAVALILAASFVWMPHQGNLTSLSWETGDGVTYGSTFNSAYVGIAIATLAGIFVLLCAFSLVAGSVRRDADTRLGVILAATPLSKTAYLSGKLVAHVAYLGVMALLILGVGICRFWFFGVGRFDLFALVVPFLLTVGPAIAFVAAGAVLFDVTPGLRSRGGPVIWFFVSTLLLMALPEGLSRSAGQSGPPWFDPLGIISLDSVIAASLPDATSHSSGLINHSKAIVRVHWNGIRIPLSFVAARLLGLLWALLPLGLAVLIFDRFDPARALGRSRKQPKATATAVAAPMAGTPHLVRLAPLAADPSVWAAVVAEVRLIWAQGSWLKWPLLLVSLLAAALPGEAAVTAAAGFLLLLLPILSEVAAREDLAGTRALVFSQPAVPDSVVLWKCAALGLFTLGVGLPVIVRAFVTSASAGAAMLTGLAFCAAFATGAGLLTGGGRLFQAVTVLLWYGTVNHVPALDYCGLYDGRGADVRAGYLVGGLACLALAQFRNQGARKDRLAV